MIGRTEILETLNAGLREYEGDEAELVLLAGRRDLSRAANSTLHQNVSAEDSRIVARVIRDGRTGCATVHGFSEATARRALADASALAPFTPRDERFRGLADPAPVPEVPSFVEETAAVTPEERAEALGEIFRAAARHDLQVAGAYGTRVEELAVVNSRGVGVYAPLTSAAVNIVTLGATGSGYAVGAHRDVRQLDLAGMTERAIRKGVDAASPRDVEPGDYEVILEPPAMAELMEWMTFTCFTARSIEEKTSALAGRMGERITSEAFTVYDDGTEAQGFPTPFDFEGTPKRRLDLIGAGTARGFATDQVWAPRFGSASTGHAPIRTGESTDPTPMNLFVAPGTVPARDLVAGVERGLLVTRFHYVNGFLDTRQALMTGMTRDGTFLIENGKLRHGVGNLRFTQSMIEAFSDVRAISRERDTVPAWWPDAGNTGGFVMPTVHLGRFHFTGKTESA